MSKSFILSSFSFINHIVFEKLSQEKKYVRPRKSKRKEEKDSTSFTKSRRLHLLCEQSTY